MPDWMWIAAGGGLGLIVGSFLATLAIRWPEGRGVMRGRSACDGCGRALGPIELVPLLSFVLQKGRCRGCGSAIDRRHPLIETSCALVGIAATFAAPGAAGMAGALFGWLLVTLAVLDIEHQWLPDRLTLPLGLIGLAAALLKLPPPLVDRGIGVVAGFGSLWLVAWLYQRLRGRVGLGGGDPKLFGAIGAWLGWQPLPFVLLLASLVGLGAVVAMMLRGREVTPTPRLPFGALLATAAFPIWLMMTVHPL